MPFFARFLILLLPFIAGFPLAVTLANTSAHLRLLPQTFWKFPIPTQPPPVWPVHENVQQPIDCPVTGRMPDCDDPELFEKPVDKWIPHMCAMQFNLIV
ncbi:hypothetical protein KSW81_001157 [Nannochloris sp. 'desiccata']|nr:hypothetical protein KSW81_001157 [Chlorella desiccata (nom. nud.)]